MPNSVLEDYGIGPPAPHSGRVSLAHLFSALLSSPAAWASQLVVSYAVTSHACFPRETQDSLAGWVPLLLVLINIAALMLAAWGTWASYRIWISTQAEAHGEHARLLTAGEGRTRFLAVWGIWSGAWFIMQILFNTIALIGMPGCGA